MTGDAVVRAPAVVPDDVAPGLVVGVGCRSATGPDVLRDDIARVLAAHGWALGDISALVTIDTRASGAPERCATTLGVPLRTYPARVLDSQPVPTPAESVSRHAGTRSVAEAAVLADGAALIVRKQKGTGTTVAVGRAPARPHPASGWADRTTGDDRAATRAGAGGIEATGTVATDTVATDIGATDIGATDAGATDYGATEAATSKTGASRTGASGSDTIKEEQ